MGGRRMSLWDHHLQCDKQSDGADRAVGGAFLLFAEPHRESGMASLNRTAVPLIKTIMRHHILSSDTWPTVEGFRGRENSGDPLGLIDQKYNISNLLIELEGCIAEF